MSHRNARLTVHGRRRCRAPPRPGLARTRTRRPTRTVSRILRRHQLPLLRECDPLTGDIIRASKTTAVRYESDHLAGLGLRDVTVVSVVWGGAQLLIEPGGSDRISRIALVACEAFDNYPPGLPGRILRAHRHPPGGMWLVAQLLRLRLTRNLPVTFGNMSFRATDEQLDRWFAPLVRDPAIRRDLRRYLMTLLSKAELLEWAERQRRFTGEVLIVWARNDTLMPAEHAERLAGHFDNTTLRWVDDSRTLVPIDQPDVLAGYLLEFLEASAPSV